MSNALSIVAQNTGASEEEIKEVLSGMIVSAKNQHGAKATNAELVVVSGVCSKYGLNPLVKECAAFVSGGKLQVVVMVDGWYKMVNRQETFDGVEFEDAFDSNGKIKSITCKMHLTNRSRPVCVTEYFDECNDPKSNVWKRWPNRMLRHKAYIQAARIAFGISEIIDNDEADRIQSTSPKEKEIATAVVNFEEIEAQMAECGDLDTLQGVCTGIKEDLQRTGNWDKSKGQMVALNVKHKDRINKAYGNESNANSDRSKTGPGNKSEVIEEAEFEEVVDAASEVGNDEFGDEVDTNKPIKNSEDMPDVDFE